MPEPADDQRNNITNALMDGPFAPFANMAHQLHASPVGQLYDMIFKPIGEQFRASPLGAATRAIGSEIGSAWDTAYPNWRRRRPPPPPYQP